MLFWKTLKMRLAIETQPQRTNILQVWHINRQPLENNARSRQGGASNVAPPLKTLNAWIEPKCHFLTITAL